MGILGTALSVAIGLTAGGAAGMFIADIIGVSAIGSFLGLVLGIAGGMLAYKKLRIPV